MRSSAERKAAAQPPSCEMDAIRSASTMWLAFLLAGCGGGNSATAGVPSGSVPGGSGSAAVAASGSGSSNAAGSVGATAGASMTGGTPSGSGDVAMPGLGSAGGTAGAAGGGPASGSSGAPASAGSSGATTTPAQGKGSLKFVRKDLNRLNLAEATTFGDYNKDGKVDLLSGPYWWEGPTFDKQHQLDAPSCTAANPAACNCFTCTSLGDWAEYSYDVDGDGWIDAIRISRPGNPSYWFKNPGMPTVQTDTNWAKSAIGTLTWEQSAFADMAGKGVPGHQRRGHPVLLATA